VQLSPKYVMPLLAACAAVTFATPVFAWSQSICNPTTGQVLQGNGKAPLTTEALYFAYLHDHAGSYEMAAGGTCTRKPTPTPVPTVVVTVKPTVVITPSPTVAATVVATPTASPTPPTIVAPPTATVAVTVATTPSPTAVVVVAVTPPPAAVVPQSSSSGGSHSSSSSSSRAQPTCVPPADLRSETVIQLHPLTVAERCQLASEQPALPAPPTAQPAVANVVVAPQPPAVEQPAQAIIVAELPVVSDIALTIETIQPEEMPVEVAGEMVEVPVEFPDAGDGSTAETTLEDDVQP
jgi:hypothetical protein